MIVEAIYSTCYNYLCFFIVIITTEKNAWMRVLLLITNQGAVLIEKKKHQRLACLVALARVYSTLIISEVTRDNGRTKIMFLVIVAINVSVSWLSRLVVVISVVLLLEWVSCVVLLKHHCRLFVFNSTEVTCWLCFLEIEILSLCEQRVIF